MPRQMAEGIELLADPTRRRIVALIAGHVWHPGDIATAIGLSRPAVSRQLSLLVEAGLVRWRWSPIDRRSRNYFIEKSMQEPIIAWLAGVDLRNVRPIDRPDWSPPCGSTGCVTTPGTSRSNVRIAAARTLVTDSSAGRFGPLSRWFRFIGSIFKTACAGEIYGRTVLAGGRSV